MTTAPPRSCTAWPCHHTRPCPDHDRPDDHDRQRDRARNLDRATSLAVYRSPRWRHLRTKYLAEHPTCNAPRCFALAEDVDHVTPIEDGGEPWNEQNLQALCHACHSRKTARDVAARRARERAEIAGPVGEGSRDREDPTPRDRRGSRAHVAGGLGSFAPGPIASEVEGRRSPGRRPRRPTP